MHDAGFSVRPSELPRLGARFGAEGEDGQREVFDPSNGQWATDPAFHGGGAGLASTVDDHHALAAMLLRGGRTPDGEPLLSPALHAQMTTNQLTDEQAATGGPATGDAGWGFGVGVQLRTVPVRGAGAYDWDGGLGSTWANDLERGLVGILLTDRRWTSPTPPEVCTAFWTGASRG